MTETMTMTIADLRELRKHPDLIEQVTTATATDTKEVRLDLGPFIHDEPFALVELLLLARTLGVVLILTPVRPS